mgnify:CR=1 FL=1|jgi:biopolymer transport protein ExbD
MSATPRFRRRDAMAAAARSMGRAPGEGAFGPNMTPMVDVVLVILVFFMAGTAFIGDEWFLRSQVAPAASRGPATQDPFELPPTRLEVVLDAGAGGTLATGVGLELAPLESVLAALRAFAAGTAVDEIEVIVRPGPTVPWEDVVRVHEVSAEAGITKIAIGARGG